MDKCIVCGNKKTNIDDSRIIGWMVKNWIQAYKIEKVLLEAAGGSKEAAQGKHLCYKCFKEKMEKVDG